MHNFLLLLVGILLFCVPAVSYAEENPASASESSEVQKFYLSPLVGVAYLATGVDPGDKRGFLTYGGHGGFIVSRVTSGDIALGIAIASLSESRRIAEIEASSRVTSATAEFLLRRAFGTPIYFGPRLGVAVTSVNATAGSISVNGSGVSFASAPVVGIDVQLTKNIGISLDASWLMRWAGSLEVQGLTSEYRTTSILALQAGVSLGF